jgi:hypothetical protein
MLPFTILKLHRRTVFAIATTTLQDEEDPAAEDPNSSQASIELNNDAL